MQVTYGRRNDIQQNYIQDNYRKLEFKKKLPNVTTTSSNV